MPRYARKAKKIKKRKPSARKAPAWRRQSHLASTSFPLATRGIRSNDPFGRTKRCCIKYATTYSANSSGTGNVYGTQQTFRLNSLFDPDVTNAGTQPRFLDQVGVLYNKYKVRKAHVHIDVIGTTGASNTFTVGVVGSTVSLMTLTAANVDAFLDDPRCAHWSLGAQDGGHNTLSIDKWFDIGGLDDVDEYQFAADTDKYAALLSANPTNIALITMAIAPTTSAATGASVRVSITYYVEFFERLVPAQS